MRIPRQILSKVVLNFKQGTIIEMSLPDIKNGTPHKYVIMNVKIDPEEKVVLLIATSKINKVEKRRKIRKQHEDTVVILNGGIVKEFPRDTAFDCNSVIIREFSEFFSKFMKNEIQIHSKIPEPILEDLINGMLKSDLVEPKYIRLVLQ